MNEEIKQKIELYSEKLQGLATFIEELSAIQWSSVTAKGYLEKQGITVGEAETIQLSSQTGNFNSLNAFDFKSLLAKIKSLKQYADDLISDNKWEEFNEPYKAHILSSAENTGMQVDSFFAQNGSSFRVGNYLANLLKHSKIIANALSPNVNELYEHFKYGNKNYVVFGKNGSGKTTLLRKISTEFLTNNSVIIPANRHIEVQQNNGFMIYPAQTLNQTLIQGDSIVHLTYLLNNNTLDEYEHDTAKDSVLRTRFYHIFNSLDLERDIIVENGSIYLTPENDGAKYYIDTASDGERSIVYLIMAILLAPQNSFVFIDEPERHLNGALMRNLFDKLESERQDLRFVYFTHITDFVESRKNVELIYLKKTNTYNTWAFEKIEDYKDVSLDVILSIEGSKDDIIFCEGNRSSIDCKILECLYPECEIKPVESCEQVILNTKGINNKDNIFNRKARGYIDNDYKTDKEISALAESNVFAIGFNEWENLLVSSAVLEKVNIHRRDLNKIRNDVIDYIKNHAKTAILSDYITKRYSNIITLNKLQYSADLESQIDNLNACNKTTLLKDVNKLSNTIDTVMDYDELVGLVPAKMLLKKVANDLGYHEKDDYIDNVINMLREDTEFNQTLRNRIEQVFPSEEHMKL